MKEQRERLFGRIGWLFLAVVIDLFSRKVVGWSMRPGMDRSLGRVYDEDSWIKTCWLPVQTRR